MPAKPILVYKLTPAQIALTNKLAASESGISLDTLEYREIIVWQELDKLGFADQHVKRRKVVIMLSDLGAQVRTNGYLSRKPVVRLTEPQLAALRFLAGGPRGYSEIPGRMVDVCRRMGIRGWAEWHCDINGPRWMRITAEGWNILKLVDGAVTNPD